VLVDGYRPRHPPCAGRFLLLLVMMMMLLVMMSAIAIAAGGGRGGSGCRRCGAGSACRTGFVGHGQQVLEQPARAAGQLRRLLLLRDGLLLLLLGRVQGDGDHEAVRVRLRVGGGRQPGSQHGCLPEEGLGARPNKGFGRSATSGPQSSLEGVCVELPRENSCPWHQQDGVDLADCKLEGDKRRRSEPALGQGCAQAVFPAMCFAGDRELAPVTHAAQATKPDAHSTVLVAWPALME
jgi:hypothetical protein